jgi:biopolymer transport protein ExbB
VRASTVKSTTKLRNLLIGGLFLLAPYVMAAEGDAAEAAPVASDLVVNEADTLDQLLDNVQQRKVVESREHTARERRFAQEKSEQASLLQDAQNERTREERRSDRL